MQTESIPSKAAPNGGIDRRRFPRHRLSTPVTVWFSDGSAVRAMTLEISVSGLSACTSAPMKVGDEVGIEPIGGSKAPAVVRRKLGNVYGLEFLGLGAEQAREVHRLCSRLPLYNGGATGI